ncbi:MAG: hypothetical protein WCW52_00640 [Elusimicrobiales bacterium]|jgi:hypothetical protein
MENGEIDRQLNELWKKASGKEYVPDLSAPSSRLSESQIETVQFLKNNYSKAESDWKRLLEVKEANIRDLTAQLDETRAHLGELKQHYHEAREKAINEELSAALNLEESGKILEAQKRGHVRNVTLLKEILERTKIEMTGLSERLETLRAERDEWRKKFTESAVERSDLKSAAAGLENKLGGAKEAVEKTLSELLAERRARTEAEKKIKEAEKKAGELESRLSEAKANWDAERKEWRELWDRERSVWETHRQEFAVWETRLRSEREAWLARLKEEEGKGIGYASGLAEILKESSQWSEKVTQILKLYALKGVQLPAVFVSPASSAPSARISRGVLRTAAAALAGLLLMGGLAWRVYDYRSKPHFSLLSRAALDASGAAGLSVSKDGLWLADWNKGLMLKDPKDLSTLRFLNGGGEPFRPAAVASFDGGVWVLDMAQLRFIRKDPSGGGITGSVKTPGPAPQGVAWDGYNLWSFDAATGLLYRYGLDPSGGVEASFELPALKNLAAMQWVGAELWALDARNILRRYVLNGGSFKAESSQELAAPTLAFWAGKDYFWTLEKSGKMGGLELGKYKLKRY